MYEKCNNILVAAKWDKDNTFLEPYASLISVCVFSHQIILDRPRTQLIKMEVEERPPISKS